MQLGKHILGSLQNLLVLTVICGVMMDVGLRFHRHARFVVGKAAGLSFNNLLRSTVSRSSEFMILLFVTRTGSIFDYCSCVWNVGHVGDCELLESVQRRWTKEIEGLWIFSIQKGFCNWSFL